MGFVRAWSLVGTRSQTALEPAPKQPLRPAQGTEAPSFAESFRAPVKPTANLLELISQPRPIHSRQATPSQPAARGKTDSDTLRQLPPQRRCDVVRGCVHGRSEERRVGKECR